MALFQKIYNKVYRLLTRRLSCTSVSDNKVYPNACLKAAASYRYFNKFRRNPIYTEILEHVSEELGRKYLAEIKKSPALLNDILSFKKNDDYGNPMMFRYPEIGDISPTTLRYIKVLGDLIRLFGDLNGMNICEIGVGYGGQCRVINAHLKPSKYTLVDIYPALLLAQRYLDNYIIHSKLDYCTMNELEGADYDLVISNYAFTELHREIQEVYLHKIILNARSGYITYNEASPEFNCYKWQELLKIIPCSKRMEEVPLSHPANCIIVWGEK